MLTWHKYINLDKIQENLYKNIEKNKLVFGCWKHSLYVNILYILNYSVYVISTDNKIIPSTQYLYQTNNSQKYFLAPHSGMSE